MHADKAKVVVIVIMAVKTFRVYSDAGEANIALSKLKANGVPCFLKDENSHNLLWHLQIALGGIQLMLDESDFERASSILLPDPVDIDNELVSEVSCPKCGSNNVHFGPRLRPKFSIAGLFRLLFSLLLVIPVPMSINGYHCFSCEHEFGKENKIEK
jgi:DNA-directed RNA polymerase subunit RPC12/RpoP